jgi:hypothetical protein
MQAYMRVILYLHTFALIYVFGCSKAVNSVRNPEMVAGEEKQHPFQEESTASLAGEFNLKKDLLLAQYDCKTDVDDLHSVAAFATILANPEFSGINYHAVAGTYGTQEGLYVPPNELFIEAFSGKWSDAHANFGEAVGEVTKVALETIDKGGAIWVAEAGQSDFTAAVLEQILSERPQINIRNRFHVVQHSNWNEQVTTPEKLDYVRQAATYHKIPDGNAKGNGTPGFRTGMAADRTSTLTNPHLKEVWSLAFDLANQYNGKVGRYLNEAISVGGFDFSDTSEICWMLGLENIADVTEFFEVFNKY